MIRALHRFLIRADLWHARLTLARVPLHAEYFAELFLYIQAREADLKGI